MTPTDNNRVWATEKEAVRLLGLSVGHLAEHAQSRDTPGPQAKAELAGIWGRSEVLPARFDEPGGAGWTGCGHVMSAVRSPTDIERFMQLFRRLEADPKAKLTRAESALVRWMILMAGKIYDHETDFSRLEVRPGR
jgi:hypothetical protein